VALPVTGNEFLLITGRLSHQVRPGSAGCGLTYTRCCNVRKVLLVFTRSVGTRHANKSAKHWWSLSQLIGAHYTGMPEIAFLAIFGQPRQSVFSQKFVTDVASCKESNCHSSGRVA